MFFVELKTTCKDCGEWIRHTNDGDGCDVGLCKVFNKLTVETYDCDIVYRFLNEIGLDHTFKCSECEFKTKDKDGDICKAKVTLGQGAWRVTDYESCPIRMIYEYIDNLQEEK